MIGEMPVLFLGIFILLFSAIFMHYSNRAFNLNYISIASVWYLAYAVIIYIPSFWPFFERGGYYRYNYIYTMMSPLVTVPLGIFLVNIFVKFRPQEIRQFHAAPLVDPPKRFSRIMNYAFLALIATGLLLGWCIQQKNPIPLLYLITHSEKIEDMGLLREYSFKLLDSPIRYLYHLTRDFLFPLLMLIAFGNYYRSRSRVWLFFLILSGVLGLFFAGANISKTSFFATILLLFFTLFLLKGARLHWWQVVLAVILCLSFPIFILVSLYGDFSWEGFMFAFNTLMERIFIAPSSILYYGFEIVPERVPFQGGRFMGPFAYLLGKEPSDLAQYAAWYVTGENYATTSIAGAFVTQLFGDFGFLGVILGGILVGVLMQSIQVSLIRNPKTLFAVVTYALFIYFFSTLTFLQIASALVLSGAPLLWLLYKTKFLE